MKTANIKNPLEGLRGFTTEQAQRLIEKLPMCIPVQVISCAGATVTVLPLIKLNNLDAVQIPDVPVIKSKYINIPLQKNDIGLVASSSFFFQNIVLKNETTITDNVESTNLSNLYFFPLCPAGSDPSDGETELWSKALETFLKVKDNAIELNGNTGFVTEYTALNTALSNYSNAIGIELGKIASGIAAGGGSYTPSNPSFNITSAKIADVKVAKN